MAVEGKKAVPQPEEGAGLLDGDEAFYAAHARTTVEKRG